MDKPDNKTIAVIGCGTMGHSIALNAAWAGLSVKLYGINENLLATATQSIAQKLQLLCEHQLINKEEINAISNFIETTVSIEEASAKANFIIEATPENVSLKKEIFAKIESNCATDVIIASSTSGLDPNKLANSMKNPERFIVLHFWNPAHLIPLVEVAVCDKTNKMTIAKASSLLQTMKKKAVFLKKNVPGFIANRLQFALLREAQYLFEEGVASKEDIDAAVNYSIARRLTCTGPLLSADMGGLDVYASISNYLIKDLCVAKQPASSLTQLVSENKLGQKNGRGYYEWSKEFSASMNEKREEELIRFLKKDTNL
ncbi:MAG: 3-hydroxyacyl-CoA dehydrogenase NAD-binding domain-containing protein [Ginsengibacter sp.]